MKKKSPPRRRRLGLETLEERTVLAGNVTATFTAGFLTIRGDAQGNNILISQPAPNQVSISGTALTSGSATTVNGLVGPVIFQGTLANIDVDLKGGNDQLGIGNNTADVNALNNEILFGTAATFSGLASARTTVTFGINVQMGDGIDAVSIFASTGGNINVDLGNDNNGVCVQNSIVKGLVNFVGGTGNQPSMLVRGTQVSNMIYMTGGTGFNRMIVSDSSALGVWLNANAGNDLISISSSNIATNLWIYGQGGADSISIFGSKIDGSAFIYSGSGDDSVSVDNTAIRYNAFIYGEAGNDQITLSSRRITTGAPLATQTNIGGLLIADLGAGDDRLTIGTSGVGDSPVKGNLYSTIYGWDGADQLRLNTAQFAGGLLVDMGAGNDTVDILNSSAGAYLGVFLGLGDDSITIQGTTATTAFVYGGLGRDGYKFTGNTIGRIYQYEFEYAIP